jgi:hypothetical protein
MQKVWADILAKINKWKVAFEMMFNIIRELQIETPVRDYEPLLSWLKLKTVTPNVKAGVEHQSLPFVADGNAARYIHFEGQMAISYKVKHNSTIQSHIFTQMSWLNIATRTCTQMFIEFLFLIAKSWKQLRPSIGNWISKLWYIYLITKKKCTIKPWKKQGEP